ncbi:MAG: hypothetical protein Q8L48_35315 [Archangium sp.]|nr:hypothetical protein [Archangium sp.]
MRHTFPFLMVLVFTAPVFAAEPMGATEDEFKMYLHYKLALADTRVQAMKPEARLPAIAKDASYKLKDLQQAIAHVEAAGDVKAKCEANLKETFGKTELAGKTGRLEIDMSGDYVIAVVQWFNEEQKNLPIEAAYAAARAAEACPVASTVSVQAQDKASPKQRVFQAVVSTASARRINIDKVKDYGETRYLKLFEKVKSVANGDDLSAER